MCYTILNSKSKSKSYDLLRKEIYIEHKIFYQLKHDQFNDATLHMILYCKIRWSNDHLTTSLFCQIPANTWLMGRNRQIPISIRCNDVRIDSAYRVLLQSRFTRHTVRFLNMKFGQTKYNGNAIALLPFKVHVCANSYNRIKFLLRFIEIKYTEKTILIRLHS